jgi:hypothetical protein
VDGAGGCDHCRRSEAPDLKDGFQFENSVNYHLVTLDFILLYLTPKCCAVKRRPSRARKDARDGGRALALVAPSGRMPQSVMTACRT